MIEFDVLPERGGDRLLLAHDYEDAATRTPHTLEEGLASPRLARRSTESSSISTSSLPGYELRVLAGAARCGGCWSGSLISTQLRPSLELIRAAEPAVRLGWSVPKVKRDPFRSPLDGRRRRWSCSRLRGLVFPVRAASARSAPGRCDALMAHWRLVTPRLVSPRAGRRRRAVRVDGRRAVAAAELEALGVTGVITNDPRLFGALHHLVAGWSADRAGGGAEARAGRRSRRRGDRRW